MSVLTTHVYISFLPLFLSFFHFSSLPFFLPFFFPPLFEHKGADISLNSDFIMLKYIPRSRILDLMVVLFLSTSGGQFFFVVVAIPKSCHQFHHILLSHRVGYQLLSFIEHGTCTIRGIEAYSISINIIR